MQHVIPLGPLNPDENVGFVGIAVTSSGTPRTLVGETLEAMLRGVPAGELVLPPWLAGDAKRLGASVREPPGELLSVAALTMLANAAGSGFVSAGAYAIEVLDAVIAFAREEPWDWMHGDDPLEVTIAGRRHPIAVLGMGGETYGLAIYRSAARDARESFGVLLEKGPPLMRSLMEALESPWVPVLYASDRRGPLELAPSELETLVGAIRAAIELKRTKSVRARCSCRGLAGPLEVAVALEGVGEAPRARAEKVGRNDPCPCGSGKKYKKCCLDRAPPAPPPASARVASEHELDQELLARVQAWAESRWPGFLERATAACPLRHDALAMTELGNGWVLCHAGTPDSRAPLVAYLDAHRARMTPDEARWADATARAYPSLHEVLEIDPPHLRLRDVLTRTESRVHDHALSESARIGVALLGRVAQLEDRALMAGTYPYPLSPLELLDVKARAERALATRGIPRTPEGLRTEAAGHALMELLRSIERRDPDAPVLAEGGSAVEKVEDVFTVHDAEAVRARFARAPELIAGPDAGWVRVGPYLEESVLRQSLATLALKGGRLHVETWSRAHADDARAWIEALLGPAQLTHRARSHTDLKLPTGGPGMSVMSLVSEGLADESALRREQDRLWMVQGVPALGGLSPAAAAAEARSRKKLDALLRERELLAHERGGLDLRAHLAVDVGGRKLSDGARAPRLPKMSEAVLDWLAAIGLEEAIGERRAFERLAAALPALWNASIPEVSEAARVELSARLEREGVSSAPKRERLMRRRLRLFATDPRELGAVEVVWSGGRPGLKVTFRFRG